jgi:RHS repeat-associated protein
VTPPSTSGLAVEQYAYDLVGNRTSTVTSPLGSFTYDGTDRLLSDATNTYVYDKEGDLATRTITATGASTTYSWSPEHQLLKITYPDASTSSFSYDPLGRRVETKDGSTVRRYAYDAQSIATEYDGSNAITATYVHRSSDDPTTALEMVRSGQRYFYLTDAQQSTTALTTIAGAIVDSYRYDGFGSPTQTGAIENPFTYTGQPFDATAGLFLFPLRAYDPSLGRFLSEDPMPSGNAYPYVSNSPQDLTDPTGGQASIEEAVQQYIKRKSVEEALKKWFIAIANVLINASQALQAGFGCKGLAYAGTASLSFFVLVRSFSSPALVLAGLGVIYGGIRAIPGCH